VGSKAGSWPGGVVGVGTDLVDVDRMRRVLARTPGFASRVFTDAERAVADGRRDPAKALAARFAAKEATLKALGVGLGAIPLRDIEVVRADSGAPAIALGGPGPAVAAEAGAAGLLVSMTHTDTVAAATVLALARTVPPG
jgi:holo-[acyl-carrier protein] synthase